MSDSFDVTLRRRLEALAAAAPVESPGELTLVPTRVRATTSQPALAPGSLVPLLAVMLVGVIAAGLARVGPFAPAASGSNQPVEASTTDGPFELSIHSAKAVYAPDEPIEVRATLTYRGSGEVTISHAAGASILQPGTSVTEPGDRGGPIGFGIVEPVLGNLNVATVWGLSCGSTQLAGGAILVSTFGKSGAFDGNDPRAAEYGAFLTDPVLRLHEGTWHLYAVAEFSEDGCGGTLKHELRTTIEISVGGVPTTTASPEPSAAAPLRSPAPSAHPAGSIELSTDPVPNTSGACMAARIDGVLALNPKTGLGIERGGAPTDVIWPFAWTARRDGEDVVLFDELGEIVARTGDRVAFGGGMASHPTGPPDASMMVDDAFAVCGGMIESSVPQ